MSPAPTSRDVARLAGVAQSTVSYVLAGKGSVSAETRARVLRVAAEINYRPNLAARSMRTRRSGRLALVLPMLLYNPSRLLAGASTVAEQAGYTLEVQSVRGGVDDRRQRTEELVASGHFEGVLVLAQLGADDHSSAASDTTVVALSQFDDEARVTGELVDAHPIAHIMEELAKSGHWRFLHISGHPTFASAQARKRAYLATVERLGLESLGVVDGDWTGTCGEQAIDQLPDGSPSLAVIAANDISAAGAIRAASRRGWSVPDQVVVTGWDNVEMSEFLLPSLTTVNIDFQELGRRSMTRLVAAVRGEEPTIEQTPLQRVIWRESTGSVGRQP